MESGFPDTESTIRDYTPKIRKQAADLLEPGESVVRSVIANPEGSFLGNLNRPGAALGGDRAVFRAAVGAATDKGPAEGLASSIPKRTAYVTLTDRRLVVLGRSALGRVNAVLASFPLDQVARLSLAKQNRTTDELTISFTDRSTSRYLIIQNQQAGDMIETFDRSRGGS